MTTSPGPRLMLEVPQLKLTISMTLQSENNPGLCEAVLQALPLRSLFGHVVISGDGIWLPTRLVYLGAPKMVQRSLGSVYFNAPGQTICLTYGAITETAVVNEFARIEAPDHAALRQLGEAVWRMTVTDPVRRPVLGVLQVMEG